MICSKCGTKSADQAKFCTNCGEVFAKPNNQPGAPDPVKKKRKNLLIMAVAAGVLVLAALIVLLFSGNKAERACEEMYDSLVEMDLNALMDSLPPAVRSYMADSMDLEDSTFEIVDSRELSSERVDEIDTIYGMLYDTPVGYVEEAVVVYVRATYHNESISRDEIPLTMIKVGGDWYLDIVTTQEEIEEADFTYDFSSVLP